MWNEIVSICIVDGGYKLSICHACMTMMRLWIETNFLMKCETFNFKFFFLFSLFAFNARQIRGDSSIWPVSERWRMTLLIFIFLLFRFSLPLTFNYESFIAATKKKIILFYFPIFLLMWIESLFFCTRAFHERTEMVVLRSTGVRC